MNADKFSQGREASPPARPDLFGSTAASLADRGPSRRGIKPTPGGWTEVPALFLFFKNAKAVALEFFRLATELYFLNLRAAVRGYRVEYHDKNKFFLSIPAAPNWRYPATGGLFLSQIKRWLENKEQLKG